MARRTTLLLAAWIALVGLGGVVAAATTDDVTTTAGLPGAGQGTGASTTASTALVAGATTVPGDTGTTAAPADTTPTSTGATDATVPTTAGPAPTTPIGPTFARPDAGRYTMRTTGTSQVKPIQANPQPVDETSDTIYEHVGDTDVRQRAETEGQGGLTVLLRYLPGEVQLLQLDLAAPGVNYQFLAEPPVTYARIPLVAGDTWQWQLTDTGGSQTIADTSTVRGTERIEVAGAAVDAIVLDTTLTLSGDLDGTLQLTSYIDPARRTSVRTHQVADLTYQGFNLVGDTTSDLVGFTPA